MEDKNNNQIPKPTEKEKENKKIEPLIEYDNGWTVEDLMELCPSLTRKEAEDAWRMGW